jgi:nicotinamide riboside kinase
MTMQQLADELDLSYWSFASKVRGDYEFKQSEIQKIAKILKLDSEKINEIFFSENI